MSFIGLFYVLSGAVQQLLLSHTRITGVVIVAVSCVFAFVYRKSRTRIPFILCSLLNVAGIVSDGWYVFTALAILNTIFGVVLALYGFVVFYAGEKSLLKKILFPVALAALSIIPAVLAVQALRVTLFPNAYADELQRRYVAQNVTDAEREEYVLEDGTRYVKDVRYDAEYPNGYLDIYYPLAEGKETLMTVIFLHGGGFVFGDKKFGDPVELSKNYENSQICHLVRAGYNVVSMNYALAPQYQFPVAVKQLNRGLKYLRDNSGELGLNMDKVALAGVSAGGNLCGLLCNIQTNPDYAAIIEEEPVFTKGEIRAVVFEGGLVDIHSFGVTHYPYYDYLFYNMGRAYLGINDLVYDKRADSSDVMTYVTKDFPPTFISDGNTASFYDQAFEFKGLLDELGVYSQLNFYPVEQAGRLMHAYEETGGEWSMKTMDAMIDFLKGAE